MALGFASGVLCDEHDVRAVTTGKEMLELLKTVPADLILLDVAMPVLDGYGIIKILKDNPKTQDIPVIFLTAAKNPEYEARALAAGAVDYITKPFAESVLKRRVELHLLVQRQQREMQAALREVEVANNAKSSFIAIMSHEMRTPLNAIMGFSDLSLETDGLSDELFTNLTNIKTAGRTLLSIIKDVLDVSKIDRGTLELFPAEYDTASLFSDSINQSVLHRGEKNISFGLDISPNFPAKLCGDYLRVKQILNNLLSNAFKYTPKGSVDLAIKCVADGDESACVTIAVKDTGIGIPDEETENIFEDYSQVNMAANRKVEGMGFGLPMARKLARMMDGDIVVDCAVGAGSTFTARFWQKSVSDEVIPDEVVNNLKKYLRPKKDSGFAKNTSGLKLPGVRVLVVDDVPANLVLAAAMLKRYEIRTTCVESGPEAIEAMRSEIVRYDAVFMDHMMPEMDGIEALRHIRQLGTDYAKNIPVIAFTANALVGNDEMFIQNGFQDYIPKPIEIETLEAVVKKWTKPSSLMSHRVPGVDFAAGLLRFGGDESSYLDILRTFAKTTPAMLDKSESWENLKNYMITVHGIKGSCYGICAEKAGQLAEALENAAKIEHIGFISANNDTFLKSTRELVEKIASVLTAIESQKQKARKDKPDARLLAELINACNRRDMTGVDEIVAELDEFEYETESDLVAWLREQADEMEYGAMAERLAAV